MGKKVIRQYRFFKDGDERNQPASGTRAAYVDGSVFSLGEFPILQVDIQGLPGTEFYVSLEDTRSGINNLMGPYTIGRTGVYQLELEDGVLLYALQFTSRSMQNIQDTPSGYVIIDTLFEKGELTE